MAIFKANYVKRGKTAKDLAKASVRYIQHRRGKDGETKPEPFLTMTGRWSDISLPDDDEAKKGVSLPLFLSPTPNARTRHDFDMRICHADLQTMRPLKRA